MKDPAATPDEIITAAGPPTEVARSSDGSLLVLWEPFIVRDGGDTEPEGATAWRLFDAQGRTVRTYSSPDLRDLSVTATRDGFLVSEVGESYDFERATVVDRGGRRHRVSVDPRPMAVRPADTFLAGSVVQRFYRPSDRTLHRLLPQPGAPRDVVQWSGALIDAQGALWIQGYEGGNHWLAWSKDGGRTLRRQRLPLLQPGGTSDRPRMAVAHGVTAVLTDQVKGDAGGSMGPPYVDVVSGYGRSTHRVTATTFPFLRKVSVDPDLSVMTDGRLLLGDREAGEWWVAEARSNETFERLTVPKHVAYVRDLGGTLFAWGEWDHRSATLQTSTNDGATWSTVDATPSG